MAIGNYRQEFPDFDEDLTTRVAPLLGMGFKDVSWKNDQCPHFASDTLCVWIDYKDPELRYDPDAEYRRYTVVRLEGGCYTDVIEYMLETDDWQDVLDLVKKESVPCAS